MRLVALGHLADATAARDRLAEGRDDEALHDFRVALRRLRSWERAFRDYTGRDLRRKLRRKLRNLARDTGASRDLEVHLAWLAAQRSTITRRQRAGLGWLLATLDQQKAEADAVLDRDVSRRFSRLEKRLERALGTYRERLRVSSHGRAAAPEVIALALAPRIREQATELQEHIARVRTISDETDAHEARIMAKRLRYLLEPVSKLVPGVPWVIDRLKYLQDELGDLHDAQVFGAEVASLAAEAVSQQSSEPGAGSGAATDARGDGTRRTDARASDADPARAGRAEAAVNERAFEGDTSVSVAAGATDDLASNAAETPDGPHGLHEDGDRVRARDDLTGSTAHAEAAREAARAEDADDDSRDDETSEDATGDAGGADASAGASAAPAGGDGGAIATSPTSKQAPDFEPGLREISRRLRERAQLAFDQFMVTWSGDGGSSFFADVEDVAQAIADAATADIEIERKYLLRRMPNEARRRGVRRDIVQGYVPGEHLHERLRRVVRHDADGAREVKYYRTVKLGAGISRTEIEEETTAEIFNALWRLTKGRRVRKRRYAVEVDGATWEVDLFEGRKLVLAEIELDAEDDVVVPPPWLARVIDREVTNDPSYLNINLAR